MEDEKTPLEAVGELNWQRMMTAALQFVGGGLVALHEQGSPAKAPEREDAEERNIRERLEGLGIRTDHADTIRRGWTPRPSPPPNVQARPIPTMSFEEFEAAVSQIDAAGGHPAPPQGANAPGAAEAHHAEPPRREPPRREPPRPEPPRPEPPHADGSGRSRAAEIHNEYMELRLSALEAKVHEIRLLLMTLASAPAAASAAPASESDVTLDAPPSAAPSSGSIATHPGAALGATLSAVQPFDGITKQSAAALGTAPTSGRIVNQSAAALGTAPSSDRVVTQSAALDGPPCAAPTSDGIATHPSATLGVTRSAAPPFDGITKQSAAAHGTAPTSGMIVNQSAAALGAARSAMPKSNGITTQSAAALGATPRSEPIVTQSAVGLGAQRSVSQSLDGVATQSAAALVAAPSSESIVSRPVGVLGTTPSAPSGAPTGAGVSRQDERAPIHRSNPGRSSPARTAGPVAGSGAPVVVEDRVDVEGRFAAPDAAGENTRPAAQLGDVVRETVVQGPWASGRASPEDGAAAVSPEEPGCVYDAHERRVAAIERTFESFESMVEGLAACSRGKGPPSE